MLRHALLLRHALRRSAHAASTAAVSTAAVSTAVVRPTAVPSAAAMRKVPIGHIRPRPLQDLAIRPAVGLSTVAVAAARRWTVPRSWELHSLRQLMEAVFPWRRGTCCSDEVGLDEPMRLATATFGHATV